MQQRNRYPKIHYPIFRLDLVIQGMYKLSGRHEKSGDPSSWKILQVVEDWNKRMNNFCRNTITQANQCLNKKIKGNTTLKRVFKIPIMCIGILFFPQTIAENLPIPLSDRGSITTFFMPGYMCPSTCEPGHIFEN